MLLRKTSWFWKSGLAAISFISPNLHAYSAVFAMEANPGDLCDYVNGGTGKGRAFYSCCAGKK